MHKALGKGLEALIPVTEKIAVEGITKEEILKINVNKIKPNKYQARKKFDEEKLSELAQSIKEKGIIQPLIVCQTSTPGEYELVAGERRLRAAQIAGLNEVPVIIREVNDREKYQLSLIENLQRVDLNPIEEARAYKNIMEEFNLTQEELSKLIGKNRSVIANTLRFLNLPQNIQELIEQEKIYPGHARVIAGIDDPQKQNEFVQKILTEGLSVRKTEELSQYYTENIKKQKLKKRPPEVVDLENELQRVLQTKVKISTKGKKGKILIYFFSLDDLDRILKFFKKKK